MLLRGAAGVVVRVLGFPERLSTPCVPAPVRLLVLRLAPGWKAAGTDGTLTIPKSTQRNLKTAPQRSRSVCPP